MKKRTGTPKRQADLEKISQLVGLREWVNKWFPLLTLFDWYIDIIIPEWVCKQR